MMLRCLAVLAILVSCTFPVMAGVSVVEPCPSQVVMQACTLETAIEATAPRVVVDGGSSMVKCVGVSAIDITSVRRELFAPFDIDGSASLKGLFADGIDRPPKSKSI